MSSPSLSRAARALACCAALASAAPAFAGPLAFGTIDGARDLRTSPDVAACSSGPAPTCRLLRQTLGGLEVRESVVRLNGEGRPRELDIRLDGEDFDLAYQLLAGRYGPPTSSGDSVAWRGFDAGATLTLARTGADALIAFRYPANEFASASPAATPAARGERPLLYLLAFVALGLIAGGVLSRLRRRTPAQSHAPETSMRATLERRLREGKGLEF